MHGTTSERIVGAVLTAVVVAAGAYGQTCGPDPCNVPHETPGCSDVGCCLQVCEILPLCCQIEWLQACADAAVDLGCAPEPGGAVCIATGDNPNVDGFLEVCTDSYGSWADATFGGGGDRFKPAGLSTLPATFTTGFYFFRPSTLQRELLTTSSDWQAVVTPDASLDREILQPGVPSDTDGDAVFDTLTSSFRVSGAGVDVTFDLVQHVEQIDPQDADAVSVATLTCSIHNNSGTAIDFHLLRHIDADLVWVGDFSNDVVGTGTNGTLLDRFVYQVEDGASQTAITLSSQQGTTYYGTKNGIDPDGGGPGPAMGFGTDVQQWDSYGVPEGWENFIPNVGTALNGESGPLPPGCTNPCDASIGLDIPVSLGPDASMTVVVTHTYGCTIPRCEPACFESVSEEVVCQADGTTFTYTVEGIDGCSGGLETYTFTGSGGAVGEEICFTLLVNGEGGGLCCITELCTTVPDCSPAPGDANGDGSVDILDLLIILGAWGPNPDPCPPAAAGDFDADCEIGIADFLTVIGNWTD